MIYGNADETAERMANTDPRETARRLGSALGKLREFHKMGKGEVAKATGYTNSNYGTIEDGSNKEPPALHRVLDLMRSLHIDPELFWALLEGPTSREHRPGVDREMEARVNLALRLAEEARAIARRSVPPEDHEAPE